jgi:hypothetical protein
MASSIRFVLAAYVASAVAGTVLGAGLTAGCSSSGGNSGGGNPEGGSSGDDAGGSSADGASLTDSPILYPDAFDAGCPQSTVVCNGACLSAGQTLGNCTVLAAQLTSTEMALAGGYIYYDFIDFSKNEAESILRIPTSGGASETFLSNLVVVHELSADSTNLYILTWSGGYDPVSQEWILGTIQVAPLAGGKPKTLTTPKQPSTLAFDATNIYWVDPSPGNDLVTPVPGPAVHRVPIAGGTVTDIGVGFSPNSVAVDATNVYWADSGNIWKTALATAGTVPLGDAGPGAGGAVELVTSPPAGYSNTVGPLVVDGDMLYYSDTGNRGVFRVPTAGGTPAMVATANLPGYIAIDATDVYFQTGAGELVRLHKADGTTQTIATFPSFSYHALALDDANIYMAVGSISAGEGGWGIVKIAK